MKSLSFSLVLVLFAAPLYAGDSSPKSSRPTGTDANIGVILGICAVFAGIYLYEWYTQPKTNAAMQNIKTDTQKMPIELNDIPEKLSSVRSLELLIEKNPIQPTVHKEPLIPTEPILPPPPLTQLPFPEEKPIMTSAPATKVSAPKTTPQNHTKRNNKTAVEANDPFN